MSEYSNVVTSVLAQVQSYCDAMDPKCSQNDNTVNRWQCELHDALTRCIKLEDSKDFRDAFLGIIALFKEYRNGALSTLYVSRNHHKLTLVQPDRVQFAKLVNLFIVLSNDQLRPKATTQIDLSKALERFTDQQRGRATELIKGLVAAARQAA